ncbi:Methyltransferase type 11 [Parafrankia sp. EAN1pec]|nr:Methyltransferase type 11 [Frankia sp. EAN1pec]
MVTGTGERGGFPDQPGDLPGQGGPAAGRAGPGGPAGEAPPSRWASLTGTRGGGAPSVAVGDRYDERFASLAASGLDIHGEASFCAALVPAGARILDAGCGTGRVAIRLAELGCSCTGVDVDPSMLARAKAVSGEVTWILGDLANLPAALADQGATAPAGRAGPFDLVVAAGNVIPLLAEGTEAHVLRVLAGVLRPGGLLVAGFGLDGAHLPLPEAPFGLAEYDRWCAGAGLTLERRFATWDGAPDRPEDGYAVSVHCRD